MKKLTFLIALLTPIAFTQAQDVMTPEILWQLGRVAPMGITTDGQQVVYAVTRFNASDNSRSRQTFVIPLQGGEPKAIDDPAKLLADHDLSPDGRYRLQIKDVPLVKMRGDELYPEMDQSNVMIFEDLNYRHWDEWEDGSYSHIFLSKGNEQPIDLMTGEPYDCPQKPFGGSEDYLWHPSSQQVLYVTKKKFGTDYTVSTNTDIYSYDIASGQTTNLTEGMMGYDTSPAFSVNGEMAWLSMARDGYEADKNDIIVDNGVSRINLTRHWDGTVNGFQWSVDGKKIYFNAPVGGTVQLFEVDYPGKKKKLPVVKQITDGQFDVSGLVGQVGRELVVTRNDMNHAREIYVVNLKDGSMRQLTHVNDADYAKIKLSKVEKHMVTTTDGKEMVSWVIYPPDFDPDKKYPALLYAQGGPQGALSQFYSFRWNFQLMAANGYVVIAPNRRGMPGHGVEWNEQISKDWGGQNMQDYLAAIDYLARQPYVDTERLGCVGASYGGYSAFFLAGIHEGRFKTFIAHDGVFNLRSMYGTTEEMWFPNWDFGGPYWEKDNAAAQKTYTEFNPVNYVDQWDTPILIIQGGRDFRISIGQGLEAFQAAQLRGIKSKFLYFPEENHWVLSVQNGLIWHHEFYKWLQDTL
jgi:dipeptidyl aminopeptidase/acylaminoacyl peptidase